MGEEADTIFCSTEATQDERKTMERCAVYFMTSSKLEAMLYTKEQDSKNETNWLAKVLRSTLCNCMLWPEISTMKKLLPRELGIV